MAPDSEITFADIGGVQKLAHIARVIAHPDRVRIMALLAGEARNVNDLAMRMGLPGPRVSQHLKVLRTGGLVEEQRRGRMRIYRPRQTAAVDWVMAGLTRSEGNKDWLAEFSPGES